MKAWELEYRLRHEAKPPSRSTSAWPDAAQVLQKRADELMMHWQSRVPGSQAPEILGQEMVQAWENRGYDVSRAEALLPEALAAAKAGKRGDLERLSARIRQALRDAPRNMNHPAWGFSRPADWEAIQSAMDPSRPADTPLNLSDPLVRAGIHWGWLGQIAGAAYGTALEGYTGTALNEAYGEKLGGYVREPDTFNDDITYELAFLAACDKALEAGEELSSAHIADKWLELIPFGWSAEAMALESLRAGIYPPASGKNYFSEWVGAQMRTMAAGLCTPGAPNRAAYLAFLDSRVSHEGNGLCGGIFSAVITALAFSTNDSARLTEEALRWLPANTEYVHYYKMTLELCRNLHEPRKVWQQMSAVLKRYNWIHVFPNMAAILIALWFCAGNFTRAMQLLAICGMDTDCNAGTVGTVLGIQSPVPPEWITPLGGVLNTFIEGYESVPFETLTHWTCRVGAGLAGQEWSERLHAAKSHFWHSP
ncbi:MAG: hypothetical protein B0D92_08255 [Spirochaeta sp. LUC14_002_19_P3]|nr:MAG: hypothetical protein B0D92_08255 [Spirochaeta sp. LUC14_002_19_P3]